MAQNILQGLILFISPINFFVIFIGGLLGLVVGSLPGLTATMAIALLSPFTFGMGSVTGICFLLGLYTSAIFAGSVTAILVRTPGTPASAATVIDGYPLTQKGQGGKALKMSAFASLIGGLISALFLMFISPLLANVALKFGPAEYFGLAVFGLTIIISVSGKSILKGLSMGFLGLFLSTIGMDYISGTERFTFGIVTLSEGISLIPVLIGVFALSEILMTSSRNKSDIIKVDPIKNIRLSLKEIKGVLVSIFRSGLLGSFIGSIPGAGAAIAAFVGYNEAKRTSKNSSLFGTGLLEGVAASEAANNAVTGSSLVPMITLGIPGSTASAVLMSTFLIHGLQPGPLMFKFHYDVIWAIFIGFTVANISMFVLGWFGVPIFVRILKIPRHILNAIILALCVIGSYSVSNSMFGVLTMILSGIVGYLLRKNNYPIIPIVLALVLGPIAERGLRKAIITSQGDWSIFITHPISAITLLLSAISIIISIKRVGFFSKAKSKIKE